MRKLSAPITLVSVGLLLWTHAVAGTAQTNSMQVAQVQSQSESTNPNHVKKKAAGPQHARQPQNLRQPVPGNQHGPQQKMRSPVQYQQRQQVPPGPTGRPPVPGNHQRPQQKMRGPKQYEPRQPLRPGPTVRQPAPGVRPGMPQQMRQRPPYENRRPGRQAPDIRQRYNWQQYRPGERPPEWRQYRSMDPRLWERNFSATRRFRWEPYHRPGGWYYRRWTFGMVLPSIFWSRSYWITDYWRFDLMNPPYGYVWVRYSEDALLVNVQTGLILRVVYGVFY